jgi:ABC-type sugar transport system ATPase subunit
VDRDAMNDAAAEQLTRLGLKVDPRIKVSQLDPAERRIVDIARLLKSNPRFIILDEPTAAMAPHSATRVLDLLLQMKQDGLGLCFVSHRLEEVRRISDEVVVMRNGEVSGVLGAGARTSDIASAMIGDVAEWRENREEARERLRSDEIIFDANVRVWPWATPARIHAARGEVVGLTGLLGSGANLSLRLLAGAEPSDVTVVVGQKRAAPRSRRAAARSGIGFLPESRAVEGIFPNAEVSVNMGISSLRNYSTVGLLRRRSLTSLVGVYREKLSIKIPGRDPLISTLSGGNQQKVLIARALLTRPKVLLVIEPTQGVDVGARQQIHRILHDYAASGGAVIVATTDVEEVVTLCDRVMVFHEGDAVGELHVADTADPIREITSMLDSFS